MAKPPSDGTRLPLKVSECFGVGPGIFEDGLHGGGGQEGVHLEFGRASPQ